MHPYYSSPRYKFVHQRVLARRRGISWELSFDQWWRIWQESGHWRERGRGHGKYAMSRDNDTGPYAEGNVFIQLATLNSSFTPRKRTTLPPGIQRNPDGRFKVSKMLNGKLHYLGLFNTEDEAVHAYANNVFRRERTRKAA